MFAKCRTIEGGVQLEVDLEAARLLYELVEAASLTDSFYRGLKHVASALKLNLGIK